MAKKKGFGISPITNTIYYGTQDTENHMWIGQKIDVTNEVIDVCMVYGQYGRLRRQERRISDFIS